MGEKERERKRAICFLKFSLLYNTSITYLLYNIYITLLLFRKRFLSFKNEEKREK